MHAFSFVVENKQKCNITKNVCLLNLCCWIGVITLILVKTKDNMIALGDLTEDFCLWWPL